MSKIAYFQCPTGISGDMCLGALVSLGVPLEYLVEKLNGLGIDQEYQLRVELVHRQTQQATKIHVDLLSHHDHDHNHDHGHSHHHSRHLPEIEEMIIKGNLPPQATAWSLAVFRQLAVAEGAVHGIEPEKVHFHEVGAVDSIVDIVGTCLGLDWLGINTNNEGLPLIYCSPFPTGGGIVRAAHGKIPVPVPAVLKLWEMRNCPVYSNGIERELVTPTGAAIATTLARSFGSPPPMNLQQVGLGAGSQDLPIPNILRIWIGESSTHHNHVSITTNNVPHHHPENVPHHHPELETISVLETQIDDLNPQIIGYVFDALFAAGAVDVFTQSIGMKKSRPGILLTVICHPENVSSCEEILFRETTTLGIRCTTQKRRILNREIQKLDTPYGQVGIKVAWQGKDAEKVINVQPEYEDCAELARKNHIPWQEIHRLALRSWYDHNSHKYRTPI
ncbi:MAG: nickel pincer cofactor biosynthesis protein LarC [Sphaerospermopsis sp. SIO1G1]|nr:nickel pincer cofactor biosynthesis protein LarC [Sphaerospermopsis sp. SIO1G1]